MNIKDLQKQKGYVIITEYFEQYTWGINGSHKVNKILTNENKPFKFKKDAIDFTNKHNIRSYTKKGQPNEGYGSIGSKSFKVSYMKASELSEQQRYYKII